MESLLFIAPAGVRGPQRRERRRPCVLLQVLKDNVFVFVLGRPHTYQLLDDLGSGVLKVLENELSMSAERRIPDESRARSPPGLSAARPPESEASRLHIQAYASPTVPLHQQITIFPHNRPAVSKAAGLFL